MVTPSLLWIALLGPLLIAGTSPKNEDTLLEILEVIGPPRNSDRQQSNPFKQSIVPPPKTNSLSSIRPEDLFVIELEEKDKGFAEQVAQSAGFRIIRPLQSFPHIFVAERLRRRKRNVQDVVQALMDDHRVHWAEHIVPVVRQKRKSVLNPSSIDAADAMNVPRTWQAGLTGKGVVVAIICRMKSPDSPPLILITTVFQTHVYDFHDDGVDYRHPALSGQYRSDLSFDYSRQITDAAPEPGEDNVHGTNCAGVISMEANSSCGTGIAHKAQLVGVKTLSNDELLNDIIEGEAFAHRHKQIGIYSVSWGPLDDGRTAQKPERLARLALDKGLREGRGGLGSLYVWASGNGGLEGDDCAMDGYASNEATLTFGVVDSSWRAPWFMEGCPAVLASVTEGTGGHGHTKGMMTTGTEDRCSIFSGSSAAAPTAAGILALALEANPSLAQRDVQHLIVRTSVPDRMIKKDPEPWAKNAAGLHFHRKLGFGLMDASRITKAASKWTTVPKEHVCTKMSPVINGSFSSTSPIVVPFPFSGCETTSAEITFLERIRLEVSLSHPSRGTLNIWLTSPKGTRVELLSPRREDHDSSGLVDWPFVSVQHWGEDPRGTWNVEIFEKSAEPLGGKLVYLSLTARGTKEDPLKQNSAIFESL